MRQAITIQEVAAPFTTSEALNNPNLGEYRERDSLLRSNAIVTVDTTITTITITTTTIIIMTGNTGTITVDNIKENLITTGNNKSNDTHEKTQPALPAANYRETAV